MSFADPQLTPTVLTEVVSGTTLTATGLFASREYGNGVTRDITWDTVKRTPVTISASFGYLDGETPMTAYVQHDLLTRDLVGRVTGIEDAVTGSRQCYTYDGFNRLEPDPVARTWLER